MLLKVISSSTSGFTVRKTWDEIKSLKIANTKAKILLIGHFLSGLSGEGQGCYTDVTLTQNRWAQL